MSGCIVGSIVLYQEGINVISTYYFVFWYSATWIVLSVLVHTWWICVWRTPKNVITVILRSFPFDTNTCVGQNENCILHRHFVYDPSQIVQICAVCLHCPLDVCWRIQIPYGLHFVFHRCHSSRYFSLLLPYESGDGWRFPVLLKHCMIIISPKGNGWNIRIFCPYPKNDSLWPVFWLDADAGDGMLEAPALQSLSWKRQWLRPSTWSVYFTCRDSVCFPLWFILSLRLHSVLSEEN